MALPRTPALLAASIATVLSLAACSSPVDPAANTGTANASGAPAAGETLVVYSNSVSDGRGEWLTEKASAEGFNLQFVDLGGGDIQNRLLAEKNNPVADVTFGLNNVFFEKLKADDVLQPYTPSWSDKVEAGVGDDETFWPIVREPIMLVYSNAAYPGGQGAPTDWPDLWKNPEFHNRYEVPTSLGGATSQMVLSGILSRYKDEAGQAGVSEEGWQAIQQFFANGNPSVQGEDLYARMKAGDVNMGQMWLAGKATREKQYDLETTAVQPQVGVPMATQHVAVVKGSDSMNEAQRFVDWFGGAELQAAWSNEFFTAPTNKDALPMADQDAVKATEAFKAQDIDWEFVAQNIDSWVERIQLQYLG